MQAGDTAFTLYYRLLRSKYHLPACEAFSCAKRALAEHPLFFEDPTGTIRQALALSSDKRED